MNVAFRNGKLRRCYEKSSEAFRAYGDAVGRKYIQRIDIMKAARSLKEVGKLPGLDCHPLKGAREGQWALRLSGDMRLIFTMEDDMTVRIEDVSKHYD